ncbi:hypothetical protein [Acinetobacter lwoffii]|uniref:hypothetical protein n=1 Tax=Acinetobacter lwoffii TaxID=28090 RepID=UPI0002D0FD9D|nr:hypothetical protein F924_01995 [Acinetobacter lwoffii ATCC 9957 = CIP 70.31]
MFAVKLKVIILIIGAAALAGCNSVNRLKSEVLHPFASPEELIAKRALNQRDGSAKDYVYLWGQAQKNNTTQAMYPRSILTQYCHEQGGKFSLLYKSNFSAVADVAQRKRLSANRGVVQGSGAYQCRMDDLTESWIVSIEPTSERQVDKSSQTRSVRLLTQVMSPSQAKNFYRPTKARVAVEKTTPASIKTTTSPKTPAAKTTNELKESARKELERKELERKELEKKEAEKKQLAAASARATVAETPQQNQMKIYVAARRDINSGKNLNNACNNAQRAYNYGKLQGTEGTRVYTESGMLVARCLTSVPSYSSRFSNAKGQAVKILQNLANNYNHAGAKNMLRQVK